MKINSSKYLTDFFLYKTGLAFQVKVKTVLFIFTTISIYKTTFAQYNGGLNSMSFFKNVSCISQNPVFFSGYHGGVNSSFYIERKFCVPIITGNIPYVGGKNNGFAESISLCQLLPPLQNIFAGGYNDGFTNNVIDCKPPQTTSLVYYGGLNNGFSLVEDYCPIPSALPPTYFGGKKSGFNVATMDCPPSSLSFNSYSGGIKSSFCSMQTTCTLSITGTMPYIGGNSDGFADISNTCPLDLPLANIYVGNKNDGFASTNTECPPDFSNVSVVYYGGKNNGFDLEIQNITCPVVAPLPVELLYFNADCHLDDITLYWSTASQTNNNFFTIEKSSDGITFTEIATVMGAGTTSMLKNYTISDNTNTSDNILYYRLSQTDIDGSNSVLKMIDVNCHINKTDINIFPNPNNGNFIIDNINSENNYYNIYNTFGQLIQSEKLTIGKNTISIENIANGVYTLMISISQNKIYTKKIIVVQ